jgi:hypothetical protein
MLGRRKKGDKPKPKVVPTELPVFSELERRGWVHVLSEGSPDDRKSPLGKPRKRPAR